jgi:RimJ/RimL family protein N-acetyltransferase
MLELTPNQYPSTLPLLTASKQPIVPFSVCHGYNPGRVFADHTAQPRSALVWLSCGYLYLFGEPVATPTLAGLLTGTLAPAWQAAGESGFILAPFSTAWGERLAEFLVGQPHERIYRRSFTFDPARFAAHQDWAVRLPPGFEMRRVDENLSRELGGLPTWASVQDFLRLGLGYCLLKDGKIASACTSVFATPNGVEIDVHTDEAYRRQGLATLTAAALVDECLRSRRQPNWECFWENEESTALARKLGFEVQEDYPVYYWEMPA